MYTEKLWQLFQTGAERKYQHSLYFWSATKISSRSGAAAKSNTTDSWKQHVWGGKDNMQSFTQNKARMLAGSLDRKGFSSLLLSLSLSLSPTLLPAVLYLNKLEGWVSVPYLTAWMCMGCEWRNPPLLGDEAFRGGMWWRRACPWCWWWWWWA